MKASVYIPKALIDETLSTEATAGKKLLEPLRGTMKAAGAPINILENAAKSNPPEIHRHEDDLWICISGKAHFIVGGEMIGGNEKVKPDGSVDSNEIIGEQISEGEQYTLTQGDMLYIPAGVPHQHSADEPVRLYIIKLPSRS